jgi:hypothetical protein
MSEPTDIPSTSGYGTVKNAGFRKPQPNRWTNKPQRPVMTPTGIWATQDKKRRDERLADR